MRSTEASSDSVPAGKATSYSSSVASALFGAPFAMEVRARSINAISRAMDGVASDETATVSCTLFRGAGLAVVAIGEGGGST